MFHLLSIPRWQPSVMVQIIKSRYSQEKGSTEDKRYRHYHRWKSAWFAYQCYCNRWYYYIWIY